ncbi:MAG: tRNA pseudouridine(38-40) synthase TruA [Oscillospiraceae bacterium]|nr:tRNA pseudouridine(38-40) synthase TruA [Oscillospiraceae bacterium]
MTVKVKVTFDGTDFCGSQVQPDRRTVFGEFQKALCTVVSDAGNIKACSRLDSGVHAKCFWFSFTTEKQLNVGKLPLSLNANLPMDIRVLEAEEAQDDFHARYSAKGKEYTYYIKNSHIDDPFTSKYYYRYPQKLDVTAMQQAAQYFVGTHDFRSFMARWSKIIDCHRTVYSAQVTQQGDMIIFKVCADGYLYNMVRIMVGTLIWAGTGKIKPEQVSDIIEKRHRSAAGVTVPPQGLFLTDVLY